MIVLDSNSTLELALLEIISVGVLTSSVFSIFFVPISIICFFGSSFSSSVFTDWISLPFSSNESMNVVVCEPLLPS